MRPTLALLAGIAVAFAAVFALEQLTHALFALPPLPRSEAEIASYVERLELGPKIALVFAWWLAPLGGALAALRLGRRAWLGWGPPAAVLAATVANFVLVPHPLGMMIAALLVIPMAASVAVREARLRGWLLPADKA